MADEILNVIVKLGGDFAKLDSIIKSNNIQLNIGAKFDEKLNSVLKLKNQDIKIQVDATNAISKLTDLNKLLEKAAQQSERVIKIGSTPEITRRNAQRAELIERGVKTPVANAQLDATLFKARTDSALKTFAASQNLAKKQQEFYKKSDEGLREAYKVEEANKAYVRSSRLFQKDPGARNRAAYNYGVLPEQITSQRKTFDLKNRVFDDPQAIREIAFAGLFGRGITGKAAGLAGGVIGGALGPGGAFLGATVAQVGLRTLSDTLGGITGRLKEASEAGVEFERAVSATAGSLGVYTEVFNKTSGDTVRGPEGLAFQRQKAEGLQLAARKALLPIGIAGEEEAALTNAFIQGRAAQGHIPTEAVTEKVLTRLGAFIQTAAPDLAGNSTRLLKDVSDIFINPSRAGSTRLGAALKPVVPELFNGKNLSDEELVKVTSRLDAFVEALKNSDTFLQQRLRLEGELSNLQLALGESLNKALVPGFKALADAFDNPELQKTLEGIGESIGSISSSALTGILDFFKSLKDIADEFGAIDKAFNGPAIRDAFKKGSAAELSPDTPFGNFDLPTLTYESAEQQTAKANKAQTDAIEQQKQKELASRPTFKAGLDTIFRNAGITIDAKKDNFNQTAATNPFRQASAASEVFGKVFGPLNAQGPTEQSDLRHSQFQALEESLKANSVVSEAVKKTFDHSPGGQFLSAQEDLKKNQKDVDLKKLLENAAQNAVSSATSDLDKAKAAAAAGGARTGVHLPGFAPDQEDLDSNVITASKKLRDAQDDLKKALNDTAESSAKVADAEEKLRDERDKIGKVKTGGFDTFTFAGRAEHNAANIVEQTRVIADALKHLAEIIKKLADPKISANDKTKLEINKVNEEARLREAWSSRAESQRDNELLRYEAPLARSDAALKRFDLEHLQKNSDFEKIKRQDALSAATRNLTEFDANKDLRRLGKEETFINASTAYGAAGGLGLPGGAPVGLSSHGLAAAQEQATKAFRDQANAASKAATETAKFFDEISAANRGLAAFVQDQDLRSKSRDNEVLDAQDELTLANGGQINQYASEERRKQERIDAAEQRVRNAERSQENGPAEDSEKVSGFTGQISAALNGLSEQNGSDPALKRFQKDQTLEAGKAAGIAVTNNTAVDAENRHTLESAINQAQVSLDRLPLETTNTYLGLLVGLVQDLQKLGAQDREAPITTLEELQATTSTSSGRYNAYQPPHAQLPPQAQLPPHAQLPPQAPVPPGDTSFPFFTKPKLPSVDGQTIAPGAGAGTRDGKPIIPQVAAPSFSINGEEVKKDTSTRDPFQDSLDYEARLRTEGTPSGAIPASKSVDSLQNFFKTPASKQEPPADVPFDFSQLSKQLPAFQEGVPLAESFGTREENIQGFPAIPKGLSPGERAKREAASSAIFGGLLGSDGGKDDLYNGKTHSNALKGFKGPFPKGQPGDKYDPLFNSPSTETTDTDLEHSGFKSQKTKASGGGQKAETHLSPESLGALGIQFRVALDSSFGGS